MAAIIKTIKPAGGGDYTTLQAFENAAQTAGTLASPWHAECYRGNLGSLSIGARTYIATPSAHPYFYAASGEQHNGKLTQNISETAHISAVGGTPGIIIEYDIATNYCDITGLRISSNNSIAITAAATDSSVGHLLNRLLIEVTGNGGGTNGGAIRMSITGTTPINGLTIRNCNITMSGNATQAIRFYCGNGSASTDIHHNLYLYNVGIQSTGTLTYGLRLSHNSSTFSYYPDTTIYNVAITGTSITTCYSKSDAAIVATGTHNLSSDATAFGSANLQLSKTQAATWTATNDHVTPITGSALLDNGVDLSATAISPFSVDILGQSRPLGPAWDIGGVEFPAVSAPAAELELPLRYRVITRQRRFISSFPYEIDPDGI